MTEVAPAPSRSTAIVTMRLVTAADAASPAPSGTVMSETKSASRTPMPPGSPMITKPAIHDRQVANATSAPSPHVMSAPSAVTMQMFIAE